MKFTRLYSKPGIPVADQVKWKTLDVQILRSDGTTKFAMKGVEVPDRWSENAATILADKYFRKAGVPSRTEHWSDKDCPNIPEWLMRSKENPTFETKLSGETSARQVFHRLAGHWTYWGWKEKYFSDNSDAQVFYDEIFLMLANQVAAPNSPQWFNTGLWWAYGITGEPNGQWVFDSAGNITPATDAYSRPQVSACFIQSVSDDLVSPGGIMDLWVRETRLFKYGSGTGSNFSAIRGKDESLSGGGKSSGLMSFLEIGDRAAGAIKSGGTTRRAAKMVCLDMDHPEIEDFIEWKSREERKAKAMERGSDGEFSADYEGEAIRTVGGQNSNNSVRVTNDFLNQVETDGSWTLRNRLDGKPNRTVRARDLWKKIITAAWASGDPGVQFHDTINEWNTCKADGDIVASNPCSEYMFLNDTACNLASLNLGAFLTTGLDFDSKSFEHATMFWTVVLDISVGMAAYPSREIAEGSYKYRTLGLGYANLGGLLIRKGLAYDSDEGRHLAACITNRMHLVALVASRDMAKNLGAFPRCAENSTHIDRVVLKHGEEARKISATSYLFDANTGWRNAQVTLLAPTGTISFVMDCDTTGVEPEFALVKYKKLAGGGMMKLVNPAIEAGLKALGYKPDKINLIRAHITTHDSLAGCNLVEDKHKAVFACAVGPDALAPMAHVKMVAAVQPFLSGAVSKTVNFPANGTVEDVDQIYREAHRLGLKSIALYRDESKTSQPVTTKKPNLATKELAKSAVAADRSIIPRNALASRRRGYTQKFKVDGQTVYLRTGEYENGALGEVFIDLSKEGSMVRALMNAFAKSVSIGLQYGVPLHELVDAFTHTRFEPAGIVEGHTRIKLCSSIIDAIFRDLGITYLGQEELANTQPGPVVQDSTIVSFGTVEFTPRPSGEACRECGGAMIQTGTCFTCTNCNATSGGCS